MTDDSGALWNRRYAAPSALSEWPEPADVLSENLFLLPANGRALDLACGLGGNALQLAAAGLDTSAWDISEVAVTRLTARAAELSVRLDVVTRDVIKHPPSPASFDVIVVSRFLHRPIMTALCTALRPGGLLFYQTFCKMKVAEVGPSNPDYLLDDNELLHLCNGLRVRAYRDNAAVGDHTGGLRNSAWLIGQQP